MSDESTKTARRPYRKRRRAESEEATRRQITEATVGLHGSVGPARTTVSAIADRAGVQRATVYRHFPDEEGLYAACSAHYLALNPPPDMAAWAETADSEGRLRRALGEMYAWYARTESMLENTTRDEPLVAALRPSMEEFRAAVNAGCEAVVAGRVERGGRRRRVRAVVAHALDFATWRSLVREHGLGEREAVELMVALAAAAAGSGPPVGARRA